MSKVKKPVLIDLEPEIMSRSKKKPRVSDTNNTTEFTPATAPPVPDLEHGALEPAPDGRSMRMITALAARKPSRLAALFWAALVSFVGFAVSMAAWDFVTGLLSRNPVLGGIASALVGLVLFLLVLMAGREWHALGRLKRIDGLRRAAEAALNAKSVAQAKLVAEKTLSLYANRRELEQARLTVQSALVEQFDADGVFAALETDVLAPLDRAATLEIEAAARQVATVTAIVPLALADLITALTANLRMIRRIAEIYGGKSGTLGNWRLTRAVMTHLVATGAVAVGDDLIGSIAGGGLMSKVSRRFGEGIINGALTARVGIAAMDVCRPVPFLSEKKPKVTVVVKRALVGLFPSSS